MTASANIKVVDSTTFLQFLLFVSDEVDVIGYTSTQSDTDDHCSVQSGSSDSGVAMSTSRLTLSEMEML